MAEQEKSKDTFNSGQSQRIKVEVKRSGGTSEPISKNLILELIKTYNPEWKDSDLTHVIPVISDPKYEGPIDIAGIDPDLNEGHKKHVSGQRFELKVLKTLEIYSKNERIGLKIFHDVKFNREKLDALSQVFETDVTTFDTKKLSDLGFKKDFRTGTSIINLEVDIIVVSPKSILLVEVKSNSNGALPHPFHPCI
jgi:hypothetical protein